MSTDDRWEPGEDEQAAPALDLGSVQETDAWFERLARRSVEEQDHDDELTALFIDLTDEIDGSSAARATERLRATMGERPVWVLGAEEASDEYAQAPAAADAFPRFAVGAVPHPHPVPARKPGMQTKVARWAPVAVASAAAMVFFSSGVSVAMGNAPTLPMTKVSDVVSRLTGGEATPKAPTAHGGGTATGSVAGGGASTRARNEQIERQITDAKQALELATTPERVAQLQITIDALKAKLAATTPSPTGSASPIPTSGPTQPADPAATGTPTAEPSDTPTSAPTDTATSAPTDTPTDTPSATTTSPPSTDSALVLPDTPTDISTP